MAGRTSFTAGQHAFSTPFSLYNSTPVDYLKVFISVSNPTPNDPHFLWGVPAE
jgi:hypothetical protein